MTNKTVTDASFAIQDDLDNTKKAVFQCASLVTGTTYTYTFPAINGIFITDAGTQGIGGAKTFTGATQNVGSATVATTCNFAYGATTTGVTKTVNIGTAGLSGSTTNINIGSAVSGALGYISLQAPSVNIAQTGTNVNYFSIIGNTTGNNPQIQAVGSDTNINLTLVPKGTGFTFARSDFTFRGNLSMQSTSIAGNPVIFYVSDQSGATVTEYGRQDGVASAAILDFHTGATVTDYDSRVNATGGTGTSGGGNLQFVASNVYLAGLSTANSSLQVSTVTSAVNSVKIIGAITTASPTIAAQGTDTNIDLSLSAKGTGSIISNAPIQLKNYTVATLPTAGTAGRRAYVTDATSPTWLGTLTGGGAVKCPVFDNGTAWVAG